MVLCSTSLPRRRLRGRFPPVPEASISPIWRCEDRRRTRKAIGTGGVPGAKALGACEQDVQMNFAALLVVAIDSGDPIVILAGGALGAAHIPVGDGDTGWPRSQQGHRVDHTTGGRGNTNACRWQDRRLPGFSARSSRIARQKDRPRCCIRAGAQGSSLRPLA